ncbi:MAG TPA: putative metal-binding motif-containing protein, partial [Myxococcaceae bacterium]|nr:putative metal-binding motif-containing protein [Myxococcaceae bacterium]
MKRSMIALLAMALVCACGTRKDTSALFAKIQISTDLPATCVVFQVRKADGEVLAEKRLDRPAENELRVGIYRNDYPEEVVLRAEPHFGQGCADGTMPNGRAVEQSATFPKVDTREVSLALAKPAEADDRDHDGFAGPQAGGPDCNDDNENIHPQVSEQCNTAVDFDCNGKAGCGDPACSATACVNPPTKVSFLTPARRAAAGACSAVLTLQTRDANDTPQSALAPTAITLTAQPAAGLEFFSDPACTQKVTQVSIPTGQTTASFYFRGTVAGTSTLRAAPSGIAAATQVATVDPGTPAALAFTSAAQTLLAGSCSQAVALQARDAFGNASAPPGASATLTFAPPAAGLAFYSDANCGTAVTSVPLDTSGNATFYFRATRAGGVRITATTAGLTPATQDETITAGEPSAIAFATAPQTLVAGICSDAVKVEARDAQGNPSSVATATPITLTADPATLAFYTDGNCNNPLTALSIPAGGSSASFRFKASAAGNVNLTASTSGLGQATQVVTVTPAFASQLVFTTVAQSRTAGQCSGAVAVQTRDQFGSPSNVSAPTQVTLAATPSAGFTFFADAGCTTAVTSTTVAANTNSATFYFLGTASGAVTVTATATGMPQVTQVQTITAATALALGFRTAAQTVTVGNCSGLTEIEARDQYGNPSGVATARTVTLSVPPTVSGFAFYSDAGCNTVVTQVTIPIGNITAGFYFKGTQAGQVNITAATPSFASASQVQTLAPGAPTALAFATSAQMVAAGTCSAPLRVQVRDSLQNPSPVPSPLLVSLTAMPNAGSSFGFYSDAGCNSPVSTLTLAQGTHTQDVYFKGTLAGSVAVTASAANLSPANQSQSIVAGSASALLFSSAALTLTAGTCSAAVTVQARDAFGNPANVSAATPVALTGPSGVTFFSNPSCGTTTAQVNIAAGANTATFYFRANIAGPTVLTANAGSLGTDSQTQTVTAGAPSTLAFTSSPQTIAAGACSGEATLQLRDSFGNPTVSAAGASLTLAVTPNNAVSFYATSDCSGTAVTSVPVAAGAGDATFYFSGTVARGVTLTVSGTGLTPISQSATIT